MAHIEVQIPVILTINVNTWDTQRGTGTIPEDIRVDVTRYLRGALALPLFEDTETIVTLGESRWQDITEIDTIGTLAIGGETGAIRVLAYGITIQRCDGNGHWSQRRGPCDGVYHKPIDGTDGEGLEILDPYMREVYGDFIPRMVCTRCQEGMFSDI
jgi:hypothetical protein